MAAPPLKGRLPYVYTHTPEQEEKWQRFLAETRPLLPVVGGPIYTEDWVHRFLVARKWDYAAALEQLTNSIAWRKQFGADTILDGPPPDPSIDKFVARGIHGVSRDGFLVLWERPGLSRYDKIVPLVGPEAMVRAKVYNREVQRRLCAKQGVKFRQVVVIDVRGLGWNVMSSSILQMGRMLGKVDADNYPEALERAYVINASWIFPKMWKVAQGFLDKDVAAKVEILGGDYITRLREVIPDEYIPRFAGGSCPTPCPFSGDPLGCADVDLKNMGLSAGGDDAYTKVHIKAGHTHTVEVISTEPHMELTYEFKTEDRTIDFSVAPVGRPPILSKPDVECSVQSCAGTFTLTEVGRYAVSFSNEKARLRSKTVQYHVDVLAAGASAPPTR